MCGTTVYIGCFVHLMVWCLMKCSEALPEVQCCISEYSTPNSHSSDQCALVLQIMEEVDLNSSPASYKSPLLRTGSKSSALNS